MTLSLKEERESMDGYSSYLSDNVMPLSLTAIYFIRLFLKANPLA